MTSWFDDTSCDDCGYPAAVHAAGGCWTRHKPRAGWEDTETPTDCDCAEAPPVAGLHGDRPVSARLLWRREAWEARVAGASALIAVAAACRAQLAEGLEPTARRVVRIRALQTVQELHRRGFARCAACESAGQRGRWHHESEPCPQQEPAGDSVRT